MIIWYCRLASLFATVFMISNMVISLIAMPAKVASGFPVAEYEEQKQDICNLCQLYHTAVQLPRRKKAYHVIVWFQAVHFKVK